MRKKGVIAGILLTFCFISSYSQSVGTEMGNIAPEIRLPDPAGDTIALSSFRGKLVLIDFWATWCAPCANEQPELAKLYRKYKDQNFIHGKGLEIYGVSLDSKRTNWENFINKHGLTWPQVSDLKFWSSSAAKLYNLQELPYNVLIDKNGIILAKNLHGEDLENEIKKYLSQ